MVPKVLQKGMMECKLCSIGCNTAVICFCLQFTIRRLKPSPPPSRNTANWRSCRRADEPINVHRYIFYSVELIHVLRPLLQQ